MESVPWLIQVMTVMLFDWIGFHARAVVDVNRLVCLLLLVFWNDFELSMSNLLFRIFWFVFFLSRCTGTFATGLVRLLVSDWLFEAELTD